MIILALLVVGAIGAGVQTYRYKDGTVSRWPEDVPLSQGARDISDAFMMVMALTMIIGFFILICIVPFIRAH